MPRPAAGLRTRMRGTSPARGRMHHRSLSVLVSMILLAGCASSANGAGAATAGGEALPLDWALLLPIETEGLVQIDLARMRRSPYHGSFQPIVQQLVGEATDAGLSRGIASLVDRTDLVMIALVPAEQDDELVILARGRYRPDEVAQLEGAAAPEDRADVVDVSGHRVWVGRGDDAIAVSQLQPSTVALTATLDRMQRLIARTRMAPTTRRWPPALRDLVEATNLENATLGIALAHRRLGVENGVPVEMSLAGTADADGPLDVTVLVELGDPTLAAATTVFFQGLIGELAQTSGESFGLGQLADLARFEAVGSRVHGAVHAEPDTAAQLVPGLLGLVRDGFVGPEEVPDVISPMPTPL